MLRPEELKSEEFEVSVIGGYKRESVDAFFVKVAENYEHLFNENAELVQKLKVCVEKIEEYRKDEQFLKTAIINAEKLNENALRDIEVREKELESKAKEHAEKIVADAQAEADDIVNRARVESADTIRKYEDEAASRKADIDREIASEQQKFDELKKEASDFKENLFKLYKSHIDLLTKIPSVEKTDSKPAPEPEPEPAPEPEPETATTAEPVVEDKPADEDSKEETAEFVIESKPKQNEDDRLNEILGREFKFKDLKFGTDFDLKKDTDD